ncbi:uncharacterized protein LOC115435136 [Sphaeramia orbicularis]|uniref:uncharacterized protein LOC115435136 n=1 Tax=Sphaeramia orbicularis TaxID=375764 RepID=UPI00117EF5AA|nr:uncharacterized protein LOC115435136 [Sphaeramia orbicularis]
MRRMKVHHMFLLVFVLHMTFDLSAQSPSPSTTNTTTLPTSPPNPADLRYTTRPSDVVAAVGESVVFRCGVPKTSSGLSFTLYGSHRNYTLRCPGDHVEDIPQALDGSCEIKGPELLAVWTLKGASFSDNRTRVMCHQSANPDAPSAHLVVYDDGSSYSVLIGCTIGGFFGVLLVFGLWFMALQRSETLRTCFGGKETEEDLSSIVTKESQVK